MAKKRLVLALGHDALGTNLPEQKTAVTKTAKAIADFIQDGWQVVITHGNTPQLGMIHTALNEFAKNHEGYTPAPMSVCSAMSQGYIGYDLQNALRTELLKRGVYRSVSTVITQVTVDPYDETFYHPVKTIGRYMTAEEAAAEEKKGNYVKEEPGKGFRRIVAAPKPLDIVEIDAINALAAAGQIVIACGGGGIPVLKQGSSLKGASAVIEKDLVSGLLADQTDADMLMILTNDEFVNIKYGTPEEVALKQITAEEARTHIANHEFGVNKMLPKIEASVNFVCRREERSAVITSIDKALDAYRGKTGTVITA